MPLILKAKLEDSTVIKDILGDAFSDDPVGYHLTGGGSFGGNFFESMFRNVYASLDCSFYVTDEDGNPMGCALLAKPGQDIKKFSLFSSIRIFGRIFSDFGFLPLKRFIDLMNFVEQYHIREPHYYLFALGVKKSFQGRGVGRALLGHIITMADNDNVPTYLENSNERNLPVYQKYGFTVLEQQNTPNGGPPIWFMKRMPTS